jgi:hypothetical protein
MQSPLLSRADRYRYYQIYFYNLHRRRREIEFVLVPALSKDSVASCALDVRAEPFGVLARPARNQG